MLFRDRLRNRAHPNRIIARQGGIDIPGLTPSDPPAGGDADLPPPGGSASHGGGSATHETTPPPTKPPPSSPSPSPTVTNTTPNPPPGHSSNSGSHSNTPNPTQTTTTAADNNAQPSVSDPVIPPGNTYSNNVYTPTYYYTDATISSEPSGSPSADANNNGGGSGNTIKYIGYAAGGIAAFALLVAGIMFIVRRISKKRENEALGDVFDRSSFVRNSVALPDRIDDENSHPSERGRPRPPTMIARHIGATGANGGYDQYGNNGGYGGSAPPVPDNGGYYGNNGGYNGGYDQYGNNGGYNNGGYDQYDQYGQYTQPQTGYAAYHDSPVQSPMDPYYDHTAHGAQYLNHQVTGGPDYPALPPPAAAGSPTNESGRTLTRQPSSRGPAVDYPNVADLGRGTSVTPYQAAQYAEISKRLDDPSADPSHAYGRPDRQASAPLRGAGAHPSQLTPGQRRPASVYDENDAYGGM